MNLSRTLDSVWGPFEETAREKNSPSTSRPIPLAYTLGDGGRAQALMLKRMVQGHGSTLLTLAADLGPLAKEDQESSLQSAATIAMARRKAGALRHRCRYLRWLRKIPSVCGRIVEQLRARKACQRPEANGPGKAFSQLIVPSRGAIPAVGRQKPCMQA